MDIILRDVDIKMPKCCWDCFAFSGPFLACKLKKGVITEGRDTERVGRPKDCPMEEYIHDEPEKNFSAEDVAEIIDYLNGATGSRYRTSTPKTKSLIRARFNEGFTVEDFKTVIDKKVRAWGADSVMQKYLRPETLFGTKFESYLNEQETYKLKGNKPRSETGFERIQRLMREGAFEG